MRSFQAKSESHSLPSGLAAKTGGRVQMQVLTENPQVGVGLVAIQSESGQIQGQRIDNNLVTRHSAPILVNDSSQARQLFGAAFEKFHSLFPDEYLNNVRGVAKRPEDVGKPDRQPCRHLLSRMDKMDVDPKTLGDAKLMLEEV